MKRALTESQNRFLRGHQLHPDIPLYNMAWRFDLYCDINPDAFQQAFVETLEQNEILRTVFETDGNTTFQHAPAPAPEVCEVWDLSKTSDPQAVLKERLPDWVQAPFDLGHSTIRCTLVHLGPSHWVWLLCQHHIVCDAQSGAVLFDQVSQRYTAQISDNSEPAASTFDYFDSSPFQTTPIDGNQAGQSAASSPPYGSAAKRGGYSRRLTIPGGPSVSEAIEAAITQSKFRLFTPELSRLALYLTAYFAYLHRVTGDERITIGVPSHNRMTPDDRRALGLFVEVLPFPLDLNPSDTLEVLHRKVKAGMGNFLKQARPGAVANTDTGSISAVLNYIQARFGSFAGHPAKAEWLHSGANDAAHAIRLHVTDFDGSGQAGLFMDVHDEVLSAVDADNLVSHFRQVLDTLLSAPETPIAAINLAANAQDRAVAFGPAEPTHIPSTVMDAVEANVGKSPDAVAMSCGDARMTYRQVDLRSDQVAHQIQQAGIRAGSCIAVHLPRSFDLVLAVLGILKAGCNFVPIASNIPDARVKQILEGCNAAAIYATSSASQPYPCATLTLPFAETDALTAKPQLSGQDTAYVLFTSGSTGQPKGVEVSHRGFSRYIHWAAEVFSGGEPAVYPLFSSISFDLTLTSLFVPLVTGGSIRIYPERSDPDLAVLDVFAEDAVDAVKLTPSHLSLACKQGQPVQRIKTLILGGENLTRQHCLAAHDCLSPALSIINEYGPTEAVVGAMHHAFDATTDLKPSVQIGRPAAGVSISVRDDALNLSPFGVQGEIVIGGRLAQGYLNAPDATAQSFVTDADGNKVYRTGDLGRFCRDGSVEYLGRADEQIKLGGVRLELAEIDRVLRQLPNVDAVHIGYGPRNTPPPMTNQCRMCGITDEVADIAFAEPDLCNICAEFDSYKDRAQAYFRPEPELAAQIQKAKQASTGPYDAVMMLSGGKDSTYAAYRLAEYTSRVLAVTLDNGYISEGAKANIERVTRDLGWTHRYLSTDKMNQIFVDSLKAHSNVCQGCFKALYTLAFRTALAEGAPMIVTGLSRGQFFETRLTPDLFRNGAPTCAQLDDMVMQARKAYHAEDDALSRLLQTDDLKDGRFLEQVEVLDIYRYIDVPVSEIYAFLDAQTAWVRPSDTGRSTNCLINDAGIYFHKKREGFHNYALPYSWDVRMGHKTREQAVEELNDQIDTQRVEEMLDDIGFDEPLEHPPLLTVYVAGRDLEESQIWAALAAHLPREMQPDRVAILDDMPLTPNGKVDTTHLPDMRRTAPARADLTPPETAMEHQLAYILRTVLKLPQVGTQQDFFDLGVDSLAAIDIAIKANEQGVPLPATALFEHRTLRALAAFAQELPTEQVEEHDDTPLIELDDDDLANISQALD